MSKFFVIAILLMSWAFAPNALSRQSGGSGEDLKGVCELSGGRWVGSEGGNWACCWADWGCYGCVDSVCKMKCDTQRCKKANGMARPSSTDLIIIKGLAPANSKSPIVPKKNAATTNDSSSQTMQKNQ
ncbi:hypothetical protein [Legionella hackeliae]|uniref:Acetyltransferase n=1 Tax=Legionella hackeliae TaxID=449 RepID=A0A0A8URE1_LEGHA|nr:hypothetical protein [Legionella hackeliae]KTD13504.1 acetyltransferase [Legionella hackeliae]CEK09349.1 conserved exported protein of unknown function [Legionella hackeliae]STX49255.1 acetyltransferase [Legionella hackeliae]